MPPLLYTASVPVFQRYLGTLTRLVDAAEQHAKSGDGDAARLLGARLAPDMQPLGAQFAMATHFTLRGAFPLAGLPVPPYGDWPTTLAGLRARIERAASLLAGLEAHAFANAEARSVDFDAGQARTSLPAARFLFEFALPNFVFHVGMAYAILRAEGAPLGKALFDGFHHYPGDA